MKLCQPRIPWLTAVSSWRRRTTAHPGGSHDRGHDTRIRRTDRASVRGRPDHRRRHQRPGHVPRPGDAGRRRRPGRARGLRERRLRGVVAHDPRRDPLPRERRVPARPRIRHRAQQPAADGCALCAAAADHDPDLLDLLRGARRTPAVPAARRRQPHRARRRADQDRARHLRRLLAGRRPGAPARVPRAQALARAAAGAQPGGEVHRDLLGCLPARPGAARARCAPRWARRRRRPSARGQLHGRGRGRSRARRPARHRDRGGDAVRGIRRHQRLRTVDRHHEPGARRPHPAHGRDQGLAHRARSPRAAGGDRRPRALLREQGRPDRPDLPDQGAGARGHDRPRARHDRAGRVHRGRGRLLHRPGPAGAARRAGGPVADRLPLRGRPPAAGPRERRARLRLAGVPDRRRDDRRRRCDRAQPRRRQVDHVPRVGRAPRRPRARAARPPAPVLHQGRRDRRRARVPDDRARRGSSGSPRTRAGSPPSASRPCSTGTAPSPRT